VSRRFNPNYVALMKHLIARTRALFDEGLPLAQQVEGKLSVDLEMFSRGGIAVLDAIEAQGYDTLNRRLAIGKARQAVLLGRVLLGHLFSGGARHGVLPRLEARSPQSASQADCVSQTDPPIDLAQSYAASWNHARAAHSNFYYAFFLLPKVKGDGIAALYAFMRLVDNVADDGEDLAAKQRGLAKWRAALDEAVGGYSALVEGSSALKLQ